MASPLFRVYPVAALKIVSLFAFLCLLPTVVGVAAVCLRVCVLVFVFLFALVAVFMTCNCAALFVPC